MRDRLTPSQPIASFIMACAARHCLSPCAQLDRFIPSRSGMDFDTAHLALTEGRKENQNGEAADEDDSTEYLRALAGSLGVESSQRVLAFKHKAPAPPEGHDNNLRTLYTNNTETSAPKKQFRQAKYTFTSHSFPLSLSLSWSQ